MEELGPEAVEAVKRAAVMASNAKDRAALEGVAKGLARATRADQERRDTWAIVEYVAGMDPAEGVPAELIRLARKLATASLAPAGE